MNYGDYIVYIDESGDHSLTVIDSGYPIFVLACCIFSKKIYNENVTPQLQKFKFKEWGHDVVILHEREIRKHTDQFKRLANINYREYFMDKLNKLITDIPVTLISAIIHKAKLKDCYKSPENLYQLALKFCIERLWFFLKQHRQTNKITHLVVESRGRKEDAEL